MKSKLIATLMLGLSLASFMFVCTPHLNANSTNLGTAFFSGRPAADTTTNFRQEGRVPREINDCSAPIGGVSIVTATSSVINITSTAGLGFTVNGYVGNYIVQVINNGATNALIAWVSMTPTAVTNGVLSTTAGTLIAAGASANIVVSQRDGLTLHLRSYPASVTASAIVGVCTN